MLVIDDFDRVAPERQEQAYLLFNLLSGRRSIIFVGDYAHLAKNTDSYLQKIIDRKVELPFVLHPSNIWGDYFKALSKELGEKISDEFFQVVIGEKRNLRERKHFNDFVNQEFFERGKFGHVKPNQQLLVIYAFLFHQEYYRKLVDGSAFKLPESVLESRKKKNNQLTYNNYLSTADMLIDMFDRLQTQGNEEYPLPFSKDRGPYLLYETASNLTVSKLEEIFNDDGELSSYLLSEYNTDFYQYLAANYKDFSSERRGKLLNLSLSLVRDFKNSAAISYVIRGKQDEIMPPEQWLGDNIWPIPEERKRKTDEEINSDICSAWETILKQCGFDFSMILYVLERYQILSFQQLGEIYTDISLDDSCFDKQKRKDFFLLVYLSNIDLWGHFDVWNKKIWDTIGALDDEQYCLFWVKQRVLVNQTNMTDLDSIPTNKSFLVRTKEYSPEFLGKEIDFTEVVEKIRLRLTCLGERGYRFEYWIDKTNYRVLS